MPDGYYNPNGGHRGGGRRPRRLAFLAIPGAILGAVVKAIRWLFTDPTGRETLQISIRWSPVGFAILFALWMTATMHGEVPEASGGTSASDTMPQTGRDEAPPPILYEQGLLSLGGPDDRVPISALSHIYQLNDPLLSHRLSAVGSVRTNTGRCSGSVIGRSNFVVTAAHCLRGATADEVSFYSVRCDTAYSARRLHVSSRFDDRNLEYDYAFIDLSEPVCDEVEPFQAVTLTDDAVRALQARNYPLLSLSVFDFDETARADEFPRQRMAARARQNGMEAFGVFCRFARIGDYTGADDEAITYVTEGCDTFPGNSGGPLLISLDGGQSYRVIATLFGCQQVSCYPRIKGPYAADLERYFRRWAS